MSHYECAVIGAGNIGLAIAGGLTENGLYPAEKIILTRRHIKYLEDWRKKGYAVGSDNREAVRQSRVIIIAVEPAQIDGVLEEIAAALEEKQHTLISVVTGVSTEHIRTVIKKEVSVVRAMPNTAIAIGQSMTCLSAPATERKALEDAARLFRTVGQTEIIDEELMGSATALAACGLAFFMRAIRAASQGGVEIGFHASQALRIAAQTAKGASSLLLENGQHPEFEIDRVTTPRGVTISGLNQMEHDGFSSAMIKGIVTSAEKATRLHTKPQKS